MDSFGARSRLTAGGRAYGIVRLEAVARAGFDVARLPYSLRILLENLLRHEDGVVVRRGDIEALAGWQPHAPAAHQIAFTPARVLLQDFTGVPAVVDLAAMRDAMAALDGDPGRINPVQPVELVIDHSMQVDVAGSPAALAANRRLDYGRNRERYAFLRWGQRAFRNFTVVPPYTGIVHQVNLEHLARVVFAAGGDGGGPPTAWPDTLVGTDSHTPMVNGLGVLGWGVGGIEAEAAMLGQPVSMLLPEVIGVRLEGELPPGATATDLVLTVTERLRARGVVGKFVEFYGPGVRHLPVADRATIGNMSPEYGATCALFPVDDETLRYLRFTGRPDWLVALVEAYMKEQGLFYGPGAPDPAFTDTLTLDLGRVEPSVAGPGRPQDRIPLARAGAAFREALDTLRPDPPAAPAPAGVEGLDHGAVVIASITSCTNTSNPSVMVAAGLLARNAVARGLAARPWVKTSLAPGSQVVTRYLERAGLQDALDGLGFHLVGYGCATCIGNSGPLRADISRDIARRRLVVCAVLSGNRNFEGRIHAEVRANYLMSPPLVVAYALAGRMDADIVHEPLGLASDGRPVFLRDIWPSPAEVEQTIRQALRSEMFREVYADVYRGDEAWNALPVPEGDVYRWDAGSTYVKRPPYLEAMSRPAPPALRGARVLAVLGDSVTTDHISPAGSIAPDSPAGRWLREHGVEVADFNSYGARRGNHEVMVRGTFASGRIRNRLAPGTEGGFTTHLPSGEVMAIYEAAMRYRQEGRPLLVLAGKEYGAGSSRDWAAKGPALLGVRAVIAESFERIHRSNLIGMGILPLLFPPGQGAGTLGLTGHEIFDLEGLADAAAGARTVRIIATRFGGGQAAFEAIVGIEAPQELAYYRHGGILPYVLRQLVEGTHEPAAIGAGVAVAPQAEAAESRADRDARVDEASMASFPASDPPAY